MSGAGLYGGGGGGGGRCLPCPAVVDWQHLGRGDELSPPSPSLSLTPGQACSPLVSPHFLPPPPPPWLCLTGGAPCGGDDRRDSF